MVDNKMFIQALKKGVVPATGCTEPVAVAYGAAVCMTYLDSKDIQKIEVKVSPNVMKNAMAVIVPGTNEPGLTIAAAAGAISGDAESGLSVIENIPEKDLPTIKKLAHSDKLSVGVADVSDSLYVEVAISDKKDTVRIKIASGHTNIYSVERNGEAIFSKSRPTAHKVTEEAEFLKSIKLIDIWNFIHQVDLDDIKFMEAATINLALADEGLIHDYGMKVGRSLNEDTPQDDDLYNAILTYSTAATDARMGGANLAAMTNSGSGNQGICASVPVCMTAEHIDASDEKLIRALALSNLTSLYIHAYLPVLSAYCATDSAAMGSAVGIIYLFGGDFEQASFAIKNMVGDASGMVCDGAGCACSMKVSSAVSSMYRAVTLAQKGVVIPKTDGLICDDIDETIKNVGVLASGMKETDKTILNIMMNK